MRQIDNRTWEVDRPVWPGFLNHRKPESGKWDYGHALLVAGSYGKMGAAVLAARACLRTGAGPGGARGEKSASRDFFYYSWV